MAKNSVNYHVGDKVVVRTRTWSGEEKLQVAMVTHVRYATQLTKKTYDLRSEAGTALTYTGVDEKKSNQTIVSSITDAWIANGGTNNMYIHKKHGHTRANFASNIKLRADGEDMDSDSLVLGHFEKHNDFVFPTQGPRSF
tara:strand:+ start:40 stop:459 length:420 start_codon:yes stop_codon:yes gene_type:complete